MVQITTISGGRLSTVEGSVASANRIAEAIKGIASSGGGTRDRDGAGVQRDRQHLAASGKFIAEGKARSAANANAAEGASLLQTADDALVSIGEKLDRLAEIASAAEVSGLSTAERAQMDVEFQTLKSEIDDIAADTSFNRTKLLQGGTGAGGVFEVSFKVGTGNDAEDAITVSIAPASVSDLSAGLSTGSVASMAGASTASTNVAAASDALDTIRAGIAGDMERFSIASRNNSVMRREDGAIRDVLTTPAVVIDLAQTVAKRTAADGGFDFTDRAVDQIRQLLISMGDWNLAANAAADRQDDAADTADDGSLSAAPPDQRGPQNKDAA